MVVKVPHKVLYAISLSLVMPVLLSCQSNEPNLSVLAFGDSGSCTDPELPQNCKQNEVARAMRSVCQSKGCDMGIMLGDNIYEQGVDSEEDEQFQYKYEYHYSPLSIPIYGAIGNHDLWGVNATAEQQIQAQVNYSKKSTTWRMNAEYYEFSQAGVHFFVVNTVNFSSEQVLWLSKALRKSKANWKVVYGHYPIRSNGYHGDTWELVEKLLPLVCEFADLYVSGHDHDLQLLESDCGIPLVVSGASGKMRFSNTSKTAPRRRWSASETYGFARLEFAKKSFKVAYYNDQGLPLYSRIYNRLFRLRLQEASTESSKNKSVYLQENDSEWGSRRLKVGVLPTVAGTNSWLNAVWEIERVGTFIRIKNKLTREYLTARNGQIQVDSGRQARAFGLDVKLLWSAQWELMTPQEGVVYLKNRGKGGYLSLGEAGDLILAKEPNELHSNWVFNSVDWTTYD